MDKLLPKLYPFILLTLGLLFFVPFLGYSPLFDGSELHFAEAAREMLVTNTFSYTQLNFQPDHAPPLLPWLQALSMRVFGVADNAELAARLPGALMGVVTMLTLFFIGQKKHDARFGFLWALSYLGSVTPLVLAKSALPATTGHFFNFLGLLFFIEAVFRQETVFRQSVREIRTLLASGLFFGLGLLTNSGLMVGFLLITLLLINYWRLDDRSRSVKIRNSILVVTLPVLCMAVWLVSGLGTDWQQALFPASNPRSAFEKIYLWAAGLLGLLTVIILSSRYGAGGDKKTPTLSDVTFQGWMALVARSAFFVVVFSPSGILLLWFPLAYLATCHIDEFLRGKRSWNNLNTYLLTVGGSFVGILMIAVPLIGMNPDWLARRTSDPYWVAVTEAPVSWNGGEWLIGVALIVLTAFFALGLRRQAFRSMVGLYLSTAVCTLVFLAIVVPKVEQYVQGPLINFCESRWGQPVYVQPSFPSYAHLFYTRKKPPVKPESRQIDWLISGPVDRQTYIIATATDAAKYRYNANLELINEENGYVFFRRKQFR